MTANERDEACRRLTEANTRAKQFWQDRELWFRRACVIAFIAAVEAVFLIVLLVRSCLRSCP